MNKLDLQRRRNDIARLIRVSNRHQGAFFWNAGESDAHIQMKLDVCKYLKKLGEHFYTEAIFENGSGRADIIAADRKLIIEVVESESPESLAEKEKKYSLPFIIVSANQKFEPKLLDI